MKPARYNCCGTYCGQDFTAGEVIYEEGAEGGYDNDQMAEDDY